MSPTSSIRAPAVVLVRYGELALKGGNRANFERQLTRNIKHATRFVSKTQIQREHGRILVIPERRAEQVARRVQDVFGIKSVSLAYRLDPDLRAEPALQAMTDVARELLIDALDAMPAGHVATVRLSVKRAEKRLPLGSNEIESIVAGRILPGPDRVRVQLKDPELDIGIDIREEGTYVFLARLPGPGGLPVGTQGRTLCLLSGGIDSPVAAWLTMKRGCSVSFVSFHSYPFIGEASKQKVVRLAQRLTRWQRRAALYVVPFADIQVAIRDSAPEAYRTILYRRMMQRIATRLAQKQGYLALVTGECVGQVASQTLENLTCIAAAADLPVLRPVLGHDKEETIEVARRIGTFDISIIDEPDCCTVFQPGRPIIKGRVEDCERAESLIDVEGLVHRALEGVETIVLEGQD